MSSLYHAKSLYQHILGDSYHQLQPAVQAFHSEQGQSEWSGHIQCFSPSLLNRLMAWMVGLPLKNARGKIRFSKNAHGNYEIWDRSAGFANFRMSSSFSTTDDSSMLMESLSFFRFYWKLNIDANGALSMQLEKLYFGSWPIPSWLCPKVETLERENSDGKYAFYVRSTTFFGRLAHYEGYLTLNK